MVFGEAKWKMSSIQNLRGMKKYQSSNPAYGRENGSNLAALPASITPDVFHKTLDIQCK